MLHVFRVAGAAQIGICEALVEASSRASYLFGHIHKGKQLRPGQKTRMLSC